jgi:hypothetical protein
VLQSRVRFRRNHSQPLSNAENRLPGAGRSCLREHDGKLIRAIVGHEVRQAKLSSQSLGYIPLQPLRRFGTLALAHPIQLVYTQKDQAEAEGVPAGSLELLPHPPLERLRL